MPPGSGTPRNCLARLQRHRAGVATLSEIGSASKAHPSSGTLADPFAPAQGHEGHQGDPYFARDPAPSRALADPISRALPLPRPVPALRSARSQAQRLPALHAAPTQRPKVPSALHWLEAAAGDEESKQQECWKGRQGEFYTQPDPSEDHPKANAPPLRRRLPCKHKGRSTLPKIG